MEGLISGIKKKVSKQATAVFIEIRFQVKKVFKKQHLALFSTAIQQREAYNRKFTVVHVRDV